MVQSEFRILMEHLIWGMVHLAEETGVQSLRNSQSIQKCHSTDTAQGEPYSSVSRGNDKVTDKGTQRERRKVFCSIWDKFYGEMD